MPLLKPYIILINNQNKYHESEHINSLGGRIAQSINNSSIATIPKEDHWRHQPKLEPKDKRSLRYQQVGSVKSISISIVAPFPKILDSGLQDHLQYDGC